MAPGEDGVVVEAAGWIGSIAQGPLEPLPALLWVPRHLGALHGAFRSPPSRRSGPSCLVLWHMGIIGSTGPHDSGSWYRDIKTQTQGISVLFSCLLMKTSWNIVLKYKVLFRGQSPHFILSPS